jgi:molybdopterin converting factor small subunit
MNITVEILGLPNLAEAMGKREDHVELSHEPFTIRGLLHGLIERYGPSMRAALFDSKGDLNAIIQIALNDNAFITPEKLDTPLREGDKVTFMLLMAGGAG